MKKFLKYFFIVLLSLFVMLIIAAKIFSYKVEYGFEREQTEKHNIEVPKDQSTILLFSKTTGFRHSGAIKNSKKVIGEIAAQNRWYLYDTEDSGIFNEDELAAFDVVIWNNSTGVCLNDNQRAIFENYIKNGGAYIGIHGSGDHSHHWEWYLDDLIGAEFSHHPLKNQIQEATVSLSPNADSTLSDGLLSSWQHNEEWYIFYDTPEKNGFKVLYSIDGTKIDTDGSLPLIISKNNGMGKNHPVAWYKEVEKRQSILHIIRASGYSF